MPSGKGFLHLFHLVITLMMTDCELLKIRAWGLRGKQVSSRAVEQPGVWFLEVSVLMSSAPPRAQVMGDLCRGKWGVLENFGLGISSYSMSVVLNGRPPFNFNYSLKTSSCHNIKK